MGYLSCNAECAIAICDPNHNSNKKKKKRNKKHRNKPIKVREFPYAELESATNCFAGDSFLGKGSHGSVYKAVIDGGKLTVAVKRTITSSTSSTAQKGSNINCNGPVENEIEVLSRIHNPRLVNLLGFSLDSKQNKLIVVEFMPNGSLYDLLHSKLKPPNWQKRIRFAVQIAKAIQALHSSNPPIIHRDIKSSNILLDGNYNARLGDFGLALRGRVEDVRIKSTPPAGTLGYLDPSYLTPEDLSTKSDVFSFGILLLEIISGRNAIDLKYSPPSVVEWALPLIKSGNFLDICDDRISALDPLVIRQLAVLAARCVRSVVEKRPSMAEVVDCLKSISPPMLNALRRRMRRVGDAPPFPTSEAFDWSEESVKNWRHHGSRLSFSRNRKISDVSGVEYESDVKFSICKSVDRSRSTRSDSEIRAGPDCNKVAAVRKKAGLAVRVMPVMKMSRSKSLGVLQSTLPLHQPDHHRGKMDESPLLISLEKEIQKQFVEAESALI